MKWFQLVMTLPYCKLDSWYAFTNWHLILQQYFYLWFRFPFPTFSGDLWCTYYLSWHHQPDLHELLNADLDWSFWPHLFQLKTFIKKCNQIFIYTILFSSESHIKSLYSWTVSFRIFSLLAKAICIIKLPAPYTVIKVLRSFVRARLTAVLFANIFLSVGCHEGSSFLKLPVLLIMKY